MADALVEGSADLVTRSLEHQVVSPQMSLLVPIGTELLLRFIPAIIAGSRTQGQHRGLAIKRVTDRQRYTALTDRLKSRAAPPSGG